MSEISLVRICQPPKENPVWRDVMGEVIAPDLAVTPTIDKDNRYQGTFTVTHLPSGFAVVGDSGCISCARAAGAIAAMSGVDWSRDMTDIVADPAAKDVARQVRSRLEDCAVAGGCGD